MKNVERRNEPKENDENITSRAENERPNINLGPNDEVIIDRCASVW